MNYNLFIDIIVLVVVLFAVRSIHSKHKAAPGSPPAGPAGAPANNSPWTKRLDIEGVAHVPQGQVDLVRAFGLQKQNLIDLAVYTQGGGIANFPPDVRGCLETCYANGHATGFETMALVCKNAILAEGQALYFALVSRGPTELPTISAFVDKIRT